MYTTLCKTVVSDLITEYADYDSVARECHSGGLEGHVVMLQKARDIGLIDEDETQMSWQVVCELDEDEGLIRIPE